MRLLVPFWQSVSSRVHCAEGGIWSAVIDRNRRSMQTRLLVRRNKGAVRHASRDTCFHATHAGVEIRLKRKGVLFWLFGCGENSELHDFAETDVDPQLQV